MTVRALAWAWRQQLDAPAKLVLLALADATNTDGDAWPSWATLMKKTGLSRSTVGKRLRLLEREHLVAIEPRAREDGSQTSSRYRVALQSEEEYWETHPPRPPRTPLIAKQAKQASKHVRSNEPEREPTPRKRDVVWDIFVEVFGEPSNRNTRNRRNQAVKLVKESLAADPEPQVEIRRRSGAWPQVYPGATMTDIALANQWDNLGARGRDVDGEIEERRAEWDAVDGGALSPAENAARARELLERYGRPE